jgi:hypothetical protein
MFCFVLLVNGIVRVKAEGLFDMVVSFRKATGPETDSGQPVMSFG